MPDKTASDGETILRLDLDGLVAVAVIATGRGRIEPGSGVIAVRCGSEFFAGVTLTFSDQGSGLALAT
jgi:hypothetical protein